jgi:hypothetical protein
MRLLLSHFSWDVQLLPLQHACAASAACPMLPLQHTTASAVPMLITASAACPSTTALQHAPVLPLQPLPTCRHFLVDQTAFHEENS